MYLYTKISSPKRLINEKQYDMSACASTAAVDDNTFVTWQYTQQQTQHDDVQQLNTTSPTSAESHQITSHNDDS